MLCTKWDRLRSRLTISIYNSILYVFGKHYRHKILPLNHTSFSIARTSADKFLVKLSESNRLFSEKFPHSRYEFHFSFSITSFWRLNGSSSFGLCSVSARLELLLVYLRYELLEDGIVCRPTIALSLWNLTILRNGMWLTTFLSWLKAAQKSKWNKLISKESLPLFLRKFRLLHISWKLLKNIEQRTWVWLSPARLLSKFGKIKCEHMSQYSATLTHRRTCDFAKI